MNSWSVCGNRLKFAAANPQTVRSNHFSGQRLASLRVKVGDLSHDFQFFSKVNRSDNPAIPDSKTVDNSFKIAMVQYFIGRSKGLHSLGGNSLKGLEGNTLEDESSGGRIIFHDPRPHT